MTSVTLRAETSLMFVVLFMTADTSHRRSDLFVHTFGVASEASDIFVATVQHEAGAGVVSKIPELPVSEAMAFLALGAQSALMHVAVFVAGVAVGRCLVFIELSSMATLAGDRAMLADERVFGVSIMVEGQRAPVLLAMAFLAFLAET